MSKREILDWLPEDVHERIATFVRSSSYYDALSFAQQSQKQRLAMVEALDFKLVVTDAFSDDIKDWIAIFGDSVRRLDSSRLVSHDLPGTVVDLPKLSSAEIYGRSSHFRTIQHSMKLKKLRVVLHPEVDWDELIETCARLPLKQLCLECEWDHPCKYSRLSSSSELSHLSNACPDVTKLDLNCSCENTRSFWPLVSSFKKLTHLAVHKMISSEDFELLQTLHDVEFHGNMPIRKLLPLGRSVRAVTQLRRASKQTVALLSSLPRLRILRLALLNGAENALPGVVENIEKLDLSWGYDDFYDEEEDVGYGDGTVAVDKEVTDYYRVDERLMVEILHTALHLRELNLRKAVVKVKVAERIIEIMGKRLEVLSIQMDQQGEHPALRLVGILQAAGRFSPNVKQIELLGPFVEKEATFAQKRRCYTALEILKKRSPLVATTKLRRYIDGIEEIPEA